MARAAKGGEVGVNGDFYEGGKFLPTNPQRPRQDCAGKKAQFRWVRIEPMAVGGKRVQVSGRVWESVLEMIQFADFDAKTNTFKVWPEDHPAFAAGTIRHADQKMWAETYNRGDRLRFVPSQA